MTTAYIDTSVVVAIALGEREAQRVKTALRKMKRLCSANLLEAEFRAVMAREQLTPEAAQVLGAINWIHPNRPLSNEIRLALSCGYLRGADLWHLATALFFAPVPQQLCFATLDDRQRVVAEQLGFSLL